MVPFATQGSTRQKKSYERGLHIAVLAFLLVGNIELVNWKAGSGSACIAPFDGPDAL
jgi:hypothetical protein